MGQGRFMGSGTGVQEWESISDSLSIYLAILSKLLKIIIL